MPKKRVLKPQSVWDETAVKTAFEQAEIKDSHVPRLYKALCQDLQTPYSSIPNLPKAACQILDQEFVRSTSSVEKCEQSADGTKKLLVRLQDGLEVESVIMVYDTAVCATDREEDSSTTEDRDGTGKIRSTLCISSQVGCQMGCTFCATGTMGLIADLTAGEIVEQAVHALQHSHFRNVVFMGMGEPLNNYNAVRAAVSMLTDGRYFGLRRHKVTVSTVGVVPKIRQLSEDLPGVSLAFSLHAPNQELRQSIVPSAKAYPLPKLMAAMDHYLDNSKHKGSKIFVEYVMLSNVNDTAELAHELGRLVSHRPSQYMINLIPWNPVYSPDISFDAPDPKRIEDFHSILRTYNLHCTIRREMGQDISGACGQLVIEKGGQRNAGCSTNGDMEDIATSNISKDEDAKATGTTQPENKQRRLWNLFGALKA